MDYKGYKCPVCHKTFTGADDEDIVVCPDCGAPHHRECYIKNGECGLADKHGTDEAWDKTAEKEHEEQQSYSGSETIPCPFCNKPIDKYAIYCPHCGRSVGQYTQGNSQYNPDQNEQYGNRNQGQYGSPFGGYNNNGYNNSPYGQNQNNPYGQNQNNPYQRQPFGPMGFDPFGGVDPNETFDGASAANLARIVRSNTRKYLNIFSRIKHYGKSRFSFGGLIFGSAWLLYRKQSKVGAFFAVLDILLYVGYLATQQLYSTPMLMQASTALGFTSTSRMSMNMYSQMGDYIFSQGPLQTFLFISPLLFLAALIASHIVIGCMGNRWYYKHCTATVNDIEQNCSTQSEKDENYNKRGGVTVMIIFAFMAFYMITTYLPLLIRR